MFLQIPGEKMPKKNMEGMGRWSRLLSLLWFHLMSKPFQFLKLIINEVSEKESPIFLTEVKRRLFGNGGLEARP